MKKYFGFIILFILAWFPVVYLFHPGLPLTHDGQDHVARIANFYLSLSEGHLIPRWAANLNWGYGTPIIMFLYPLPSYLSSLFHFLGFSFVDSVKIIFGLSFIASGVAMYFFSAEMFGVVSGVVAGILYMLAPFRFVELYVRGDIGEHLAFVFPPLVLFFILKLSKKNSYWNFLGVSVSVALLILAHNAFAVMFLPIIILFLLYLFYFHKRDKQFLFQGIFSLVVGLGLSAFFLLPAYLEGKYTLRDIVTAKDEYAGRFVQPFQFFWGIWSYGGTDELSKQIGLAQLSGLLLSMYGFFQLKKKNISQKYFYFGLLILFIGTLFMMTRASFLIWHIVTLLQKFQFPWRFLAVIVFLSAIISGYAVSLFQKSKYFLWISFAIISVAFLQNMSYAHPKAYLYKPESFYTGIYNSTTDTGESSPIWSVRFMEHRAKAQVEVISGAAEVQNIFRDTTKHEYKIRASVPSRIRENTLYFPGWSVFVDGVSVPIQFQDPKNRGLITFEVPSGTHTVDVKFMNTKLRTLSEIISVLSLFILIGYGFLGGSFQLSLQGVSHRVRN